MTQCAKQYTYRVRWSKEDHEYLATVAEFPSLSWLDDDQFEALNGLINLVEDIIDDMVDSGEAVPAPYSLREYSGNVRLRMPPEQHRDLAIRASEEGVSLNRLLCSLISQSSIPIVINEVRKTMESSEKKALQAESTVPTPRNGLRLVSTSNAVTNSASETERFVTSHTYEEWPEEM